MNETTSCLHAVLEDLELVFLQIGDELALRVAHDHVRRDDVDAAAEDVALILGGWRRRSGPPGGAGFCACIAMPSASVSDGQAETTRPEAVTRIG